MLGTDGRIGRYEITRRLATGGMGTLYLAHDPVLERTVALKLFHADIERPEARDRFVREARAVAALNNPNIVTIYDYGEYSAQPFLVMEYIQGETLAELIRRRPALPEVVRVRWMEDLCAAVGYAHDRGIIHRDIKPANLMIDGYGRIKVLDFGIAQMRGTLVTNASGLIGTPGYVAPEQIRGGEVDRRSDLFSIGVVCYELFAFVGPFGTDSVHAMSHRILYEEPVPLGVAQPSVDEEFAAVVARALQKDPDQRFASAAAMREALAAIRRRLEAAEPATMTYVPAVKDDVPPGTTKPATGSAPSTPLTPGTPSGRSVDTPRTPRRATREALARQREEQLLGWLQLARDHIAAGEKTEAREACAQALKLEPAHAEALALLGSIGDGTGNLGPRAATPGPAVTPLPPLPQTPGRTGQPIPIEPPVTPGVAAPSAVDPATTGPDPQRLPLPPAVAPAPSPAATGSPVRSIPALLAGAATIALIAVAATVWFVKPRSVAAPAPVLVVIDASPWARIETIRRETGEVEPLTDDTATPAALMLAPGSYRVMLVGPPPALERREVALQVTTSAAPMLFETFAPMTVERYFQNIGPAQ